MENFISKHFDLKTWHNHTAVKQRFLELAKSHQVADLFVQGQWLRTDEGKQGDLYRGCKFGCLLQTATNPLQNAELEMGLPLWLNSVTERIFEGLPPEEAILFPVQMIQAIPVGITTKEIYQKWAYALLVDGNHGVIKYTKVSSRQYDAIVKCADIILNEIENKQGLADAARAAYAAARAAYAAAYAAADAKSTHYRWQRDLLISLFKETKRDYINTSELVFAPVQERLDVIEVKTTTNTNV